MKVSKWSILAGVIGLLSLVSAVVFFARAASESQNRINLVKNDIGSDMKIPSGPELEAKREQVARVLTMDGTPVQGLRSEDVPGDAKDQSLKKEPPVSEKEAVLNPPIMNPARYILGKEGDVSIVLTTPDLKLEIKNEKTGKTTTLNGTSAQLLSNGDILYRAKDYSLRKTSPDGENEVVLIPSERVNAPIYLNEN